MNQDFEKELRRAEREKEQARRVESFWDAFRLTLIIQFDQGVHVPSAFLCFSPLYCVPAENTIDNPPGLPEKGC